jgi:hypothetical protein
MTFAFPLLLGGLALLAVPVLIHLIMRQKPKTLRFPAFRFLLQRHRTNLRKLRLRHLLLLALRMLLLAALCLALARPRIVSEVLALSADRPVAAVLLFDTSYSMEYKVSGGPTRLEEAKRRGLELLDELPEGSRVAVLDTSETVPTGPGAWSGSVSQARDRIEGLRLHAVNSPVTGRLDGAYRLLADLALGRDNEAARTLPRLLCVFSDRTRACWDAGQVGRVHDAADQVPPPLERLQKVRGQAPALVEMLGQLREQVPPPPGQDYPDQETADAWQRLGDRIPSLGPENYPDPDTNLLLAKVRGKSRELLGVLAWLQERVPESAREFLGKLTGSLRAGLENLQGVHAVFVDVGVDNPINLGILQLELPPEAGGATSRQVFAPHEKVVLRAIVQATGKDFDTSILCQVEGKTLPQSLRLKAGQKVAVPFEIDMQALAPGTHQIEVRLATADLLAFDNSAYATIAVREPRKVLVLADEPKKAERWRQAIEEHKEARFRCEVLSSQKAGDLGPGELAQYQAVYLLAVRAPSPGLWSALKEYVEQGGGLGVIPGGEELSLPAYNAQAAQDVLPARLVGILVKSEPGPAWTWEDERIYQHSLLKPVAAWRAIGRDDFIKLPRTASRYWDVEPGKAGVAVVRYADDKKRPALVERRFGAQGRGGRVVLFTTRLESGQEPRWNNYMDSPTSFCVVLPWLATSYLAGDAEAVRLNFVSGQGAPEVRLPLAARAQTYTLQGPGILETVTAAEHANVLLLKEATAPGNYVVEDPARSRIGAFSVNLPPEEGLLTRVPAEEIEAMFGPGSVVPVGHRGRLSDALQGHWDQPLELLPWLLLLLLVMLAVENLLGNLFYRREPETAAGQPEGGAIAHREIGGEGPAATT